VLVAGFLAFVLTGEFAVRNAVEVLAAGVLAVHTARRKDARAAWILLTLALVTWVIADLDSSRLSGLFVVSFGLSQAGLVTLAASQIRGGRLAVDGAIVGLTVATVVTAFLGDAFVGLGLRVPAIALAAHGMLIATLVMVFVTNGRRPGSAWWRLAAAEAILVALDLMRADILTAPLSAQAAWCLAFLLVMAAGFGSPPPRGERAKGALAAAVPIAAGAVCVALLMHAALADRNAVTVWLAGAALFASLARAALLLRENHRLMRRAVTEAVTDKLTGLPNRRALIRDLDRAVASGKVHTLAFFDLDGFKAYNDAFGHAAGDALLQRLARPLVAAGRAYRLGGDEFCLLTESAPDIARAVAALSEGEVTASHGVVTIPDEAASTSDALRLADERMYARKRRRRAGREDALLRMLAAYGMDEARAVQFVSDFSGASSAGAAPVRAACGPAGSARSSSPAA
jgi:diguanylate cyclase (GGDEF)-like protein